jgi:hypothetical protein
MPFCAVVIWITVNGMSLTSDLKILDYNNNHQSTFDWKISAMVSDILDLIGSFKGSTIAKVHRSANYKAQEKLPFVLVNYNILTFFFYELSIMTLDSIKLPSYGKNPSSISQRG